MTSRHKVAVIGSGNIGSDLMLKIVNGSRTLELAAMVGIDPDSDGLKRAEQLGVPTTSDGVHGLMDMPSFDDIRIVFDATSAQAHLSNDAALRDARLRVVDLTPAAVGPYVVPAVNLHDVRAARNVNMVTCGGQATIPIVSAVSSVAPVPYAEIVASIASRSAGPGTRANIDEFTETTSRAIEVLGGAGRGKAIIVLNPADPPLLMRDTVYCLTHTDDTVAVAASIEAMVAEVARYVPGYRLKQPVQCESVPAQDPRQLLLDDDPSHPLTQVSVFLEIAGAGDYLPVFAGNLDIMTSAALRVGEQLADAGEVLS